MKFFKTMCLVGIALFSAGCAEERIPSDEADAWEIPADNTAVTSSDAAPTAGANPDNVAETSEALPPGVVAVVKGSAFQIDGTTETRKNTGDVLAVAHYFAASAPVELKTSATMMEIDIDGQNIDGAVPLISMLVASTSGKYRSFSQPEARPVDGKQTLRDNYDIGPGTYNITLSYYKDTGPERRPFITLNNVIFKNEPAAE